MTSFLVTSLAQTETLAGSLAQLLRSGDCVALHGDLGAGKTAFVRALIHALSEEQPDVTSPTFTLMQSYPVQMQGRAQTCWHADLYRLEHSAEVLELGLDERREEGVLLVEWPEIARDLLPANTLHIRISPGEQEDREIELHGEASWQLRLAQLSATTSL